VLAAVQIFPRRSAPASTRTAATSSPRPCSHRRLWRRPRMELAFSAPAPVSTRLRRSVSAPLQPLGTSSAVLPCRYAGERWGIDAVGGNGIFFVVSANCKGKLEGLQEEPGGSCYFWLCIAQNAPESRKTGRSRPGAVFPRPLVGLRQKQLPEPAENPYQTDP
jgi:hypothetical protein